MNYRTATVLASKTLDASGTEAIELKLSDVISRLTLRVSVTKGQNVMSSYVHRDITKIELVDGSDALHSMNGGENQALCIYDRKCPTMNEGVYINAVGQVSTYGIDFGRYLYDPMLALDPKRFKNLVLNVTYTRTNSDSLGSAISLEVRANIFDQKAVSPVGFLMSKEHWNAAKPTSGYEYVTLPNDYAIRKILLQAYKAQYEPYYQVSEARLDEDNEKRIPFDWDLDEYLHIMRGIWMPVTEKLQGYTQNPPGLVHYVTPTEYWVEVLGITTKDLYPLYYEALPPRGGYVQLDNHEGASVSGIVTGYLPNHCYEFPFGDQSDPEDWYDVTKIGSLRLRLKAGSGASTTTGVVLQQYRKY